VEIITSFEMKKILKERLGFYDFKNNVSNNKTFLIKFNKKINVFRFSNYLCDEDVACWECQIETLKKIFLKIIDSYSDGHIILAKYDENWVNDNEKNVELLSIFKNNNLKINFNGGIRTEEKYIIEAFLMGNLKYFSFVHFLIAEKGIIITPTDHMDIFINISDINQNIGIIKKIVKENDELMFVETS